MNIKEVSYPVTLYKYGDSTPYVTKPHTHKELTLGCIKSGESTLNISGEQYSVHAEDIIIIPKSTVHLCSPVDIDNFSYVILHISNTWIEEELSDLNINTGVIKPRQNLFNRVIDQADSDSIYELFSLIPEMESIKVLKEHKLSQIKEYIDTEFTEDLSLDKLSMQFSINKFSLIRSFKKEYYLSPHQYIMDLRVNRAKELIRTGEDLTSITHSCGFYDQSHFIKTFKIYTGLTPESYR